MDYTLANSESIIVHRGKFGALLATPGAIMWNGRCYVYQGTANDIAVYREITVVFVA